MHDALLKVWRGEALYLRWFLFPLLYPLSLINRVCLAAREYMYEKGLLKVQEVSIPVICVGNITLGGTGKTPIVEKLSVWCKENGFHPGIVTRGYRRKKKGVYTVNVKTDSADDVGDEAFMLAEKTKLPVLVGVNRVHAIEMGIRDSGIDIALLDDGFQRRDIKKDIEVLVINGSETHASSALFPLGSLREPSIRMSKSDMILINKGSIDSNTKKLIEGIPAFRMWYKPVHLYNAKHNLIGPYQYLKGKRILAFSGLGDNESFFNLLWRMDVHIVRKVSYPDHYTYTQKDIEELSSYDDVEIMVTTEKDMVKIASLRCPWNLFSLSIVAQIEREEELFELISQRLKREICQKES
jgi:tetraacyldisaccharide 4'-kinase